MGVRRIVTQVLAPVGLVIVIAYWALTSDWRSLSSVAFSPTHFVLGVFSAFVWVWTQALVWRRLLGAADAETASTRNKLFAQAWLMRYLPGKIPSLVALSYNGSQLGHQKQAAAQAALMLTLMMAGGNLLIGSFAFAFLPGTFLYLLPVTLVTLGFVAVTLATGLHSKRLFRCVRVAYFRLTKRKLQHPQGISWQSLLGASLGAVLAGVMIGFSFWAVFRSIAPELQVADVLYAVAVSNLAIAAGTFAVFTPNGLGVREVVLVGAASAIVSPSIGLAWALLSRLAVLLADLGFLATSTLFEWLRRNSGNGPPQG